MGAAVVELHVHGSRSLKEKRGVVRSVTQRVRNRFAVSIAEIGGQDTWTRVQLGVSTVGSDAQVVRRVLDQVIDFIEELHLAELVAQDVEILRLPLHAEEDGDDDDDGEAGTEEER
ncbi:MAG: DUF503 domain-containing protein [Myxococcales bacterium]|nr:DUF503 domain-containing protein [Myxococcales bacterium]